ncbi:hypothetical protein T459_13349 [Capsicum annuum]|uniref:Uncharacterized protein n=1 Tax=Capsicum annuum TaxID=4072 RepID=A0A2G2ZSE5_CAPAN|nr:hypothetical protein T459_13349 [Capsicum annuum]
MERMLEVAKSEFLVGLKQQDVAMFKRKFEDADSELADFREWFDLLSQKCSEPNDVPRTATNEKPEMRKKAWEDEVRRLKTENEKLTSEKIFEISALLAEKNFIWNQFNKLEHDTTEQLRRKLVKWPTWSLTPKKSEEISKLSAELVLLKKSGSASVTPVLRRSTNGSWPSKLRGTSRGMDQRNITAKEEKQSSQALEKVQRHESQTSSSSRIQHTELQQYLEAFRFSIQFGFRFCLFMKIIFTVGGTILGKNKMFEVKYEVPKFNGDSGFSTWQRRTRDLLIQQALYKALSGESKKFESMKLEDWKEMDEKAASAIRLHLTNAMVNNIIDEDSA